MDGKPTTTPISPVSYDALYVVNGGDNTISVIDVGKNEVAAIIGLQNAQRNFLSRPVRVRRFFVAPYPLKKFLWPVMF